MEVFNLSVCACAKLWSALENLALCIACVYHYIGLQAALCQHHAQRSLELTVALGRAKEEREEDYD